MDFHLSFSVNEKIFLRNPENSELGKRMISKAIVLIYELGFENFTFKKLALEIKTTEATIYRYFENKHRMLLYIINWYWSYIEFLVMYRLNNLKDNKAKLKEIIEILTTELSETASTSSYNKKFLNQIVISESSKVFLVKEVSEINKNEVFKPYKDLCSKVAEIISAYNPKYKFPRSLSSTLIETAHHQQYFVNYLPRLTDVKTTNKSRYTTQFLESFLFKILD